LYSPSGFVAFHGAPAMTRRKVSSSFRVSGLVTIRLRFFLKPGETSRHFADCL